MVVLNKVLPIDYNNMKKILWKKFDEKIIKILNDIFYNDKNNKRIEYLRKNINGELKNIMDLDYFIYLCMNYSYCKHIYKNGNKEGHICGAKIFIKAEDDSQKFLCSRHCRKYKSKKRDYNVHKRCSYIRNNNELCKHICRNNDKYCYIHKKMYREDDYENIKRNNLEKLKNRRKLYFNMKKTKNPKFLKNPKIKNITYKHILYNYLYMKKIKKYKEEYIKEEYKSRIYAIT